MFYGGIEAGGTKIICCTGNENGIILDRMTFATTAPDKDMARITDYYKNRNIAALGLGWFGPLELNPDSAAYGSVLNSPKKAWAHFNVVAALAAGLSIPTAIETDVNASLLGEIAYGAAKGTQSAIYITVGTGIGAGITVGGKLLRGVGHPEAGHIVMSPVAGDSFGGVCPYHGRCFEGMASGPAIEARWGKKGSELADRIEVWETEAEYIAQALRDYILIISPEKIILGGGVMEQKQLFPLVRKRVEKYLAGYLDLNAFGGLENLIVPAALGGDQGLIGCLEIAKRAEVKA